MRAPRRIDDRVPASVLGRARVLRLGRKRRPAVGQHVNLGQGYTEHPRILVALCSFYDLTGQC